MLPLVNYGGKCVRKLMLITLLLSVGASAFAKSKEIEFFEQTKNMACKGDKECEYLFISSTGISAMISRYHSECMTEHEESHQCNDAKKTYEYIMSEYEKTK